MTVLDLDGVAPPRMPKSRRWPVVSVRMPAHYKAWLMERALREGMTINAYMVRMIGRDRDQGLPPDVRNWLARQAVQCGLKGQPDEALVLVLRHLADRWPDGARLK